MHERRQAPPQETSMRRPAYANPRHAPARAAAAALALTASLSACNCGGPPEDVVSSCDQQLTLPSSVATDILFVIDNSRSMREEQDKVIAELHTFVSSLASGPVRNDFQIGVVTTGVTQSATDCDSRAPIEIIDYPDESGRLQRGALSADEPRILGSGGEPVDEQWLERVRKLLDQGVDGSGQEMGLEAMRRALSEPLLSIEPDAEPSGNKGLLRPGARLLVIIVSDEDDCSVVTPDAVVLEPACGPMCRTDEECEGEGNYCLLRDPGVPSRGRSCSYNVCETPEGRARLEPVERYVEFLRGLDDGTGRGRAREVKLAVIGAVDDTGQPSRCRAGGDEAYGVAERYVQAVEAMGEDGLVTSICADEYGTSLQRIADLVSAPQTLDLLEPPADPRLLQVEVVRAEGSVLCRVGDGFEYDPPSGAAPARITLSGDCRLRSGDQIRMRLFCAG
jgi:hypothetical protein